MEKLELKHLAPYLPYGIDTLYRLSDVIGIVNRDEIRHKKLSTDSVSFVLNYCKPILRPLSEIKQFEDIMDEFSEYSWDAFENHFFCDLLGRSLNCFDVVNFTIMELCFKHHLDIFGLIDKGLAVSYSDVQSSSNEG